MDLHISLVGRRDLTGEIYRQIRGAILEGRLRHGDPLPPSRELARRLSVSRTTVMVAYDRLIGEGFVATRVGAGTFVGHDIPTAAGRPSPAPPTLAAQPVWDGIPLLGVFVDEAVYDFRSGMPDTSMFPFQTWRRLVARELRPDGAGGRPYGDPAGHPGLRVAIARHLATSRDVVTRAEDVTVTNGTQQAMDLVARVLLAPGDEVAVEDPGYEPVRRLFESLGMRVRGVPVDREGLVVDALPEGARLVSVTPSHQFPLGVPLSLPRRIALLDWARRHDAAIVEDDYDSEFRHGGRPIEPLQTLDREGRVVYVGSFSKTMLPSLRVGFVVAPAPLRHALSAARYVTDWHTALPTQAALARFLDEGWFVRHIRRVRAVYEERHRRIVDVLARDFAGLLEAVPSVTGLHLAALAPGASPAEIAGVADRAADSGVEVQRLAACGVEGPGPAGLVLGFGAIATGDIEEGLRRLRAAFDG
ncbi:MAG TPA: PLP-dependent aminotransferase family protein [Acidimicrobiales bacterium]